MHVSDGLDNVLIVIDHLTRMAHFLLCRESVEAEETANLFLHGVYKLHGLHGLLVTDRDPKFVTGFLRSLWRRLGTTRLNMSSSRHPETDGLTERVNNAFQHLLRCFLLLRWFKLDIYVASSVRLGIDGIVDIVHAQFAGVSCINIIRGLRTHHEIHQYNPDDIIDP
jgi:hypothetical protein